MSCLSVENVSKQYPTRAEPLQVLRDVNLTIEPGQMTNDGQVTHAGVECGLVIEGRMHVEVGEEVYVLEPGDSIYFESSVPHRLRNAGDTPVKAVWVDHPPFL